MHNPASVLENNTHKHLWNFEIQMDHLISSRRPDFIIKKRTCRIMEFAVPADHWVNLKESEKKDKYLDLSRELKKTVEHESNGYTNCRCCSWYSHQRFRERTTGLGNKRLSGYNPNHNIFEIGQNTKKSSGDLRKLVRETPVKNHRQMLM